MKKILIALLLPLYTQAMDVQPRAQGQVILQAVEINPATKTSQPVGNPIVVDRRAAEKSGYIKSFLDFNIYTKKNNEQLVNLDVKPEQLELLVEFLTIIAEYQIAPTQAQAENSENGAAEIARVLQEKIKEFDIKEPSNLWLFANYLDIAPLRTAAMNELAEKLNNAPKSAIQNLQKIKNTFETQYAEIASGIAQKIIELNPHKFSEWQLVHTLKEHKDWVESAVFSQDGTQMLTASIDNTAKLWNTTTGELLHTLQGHRSFVNSAIFNHDDTHILTASADNTAKLWNASTGQLLLTLDAHNDCVRNAVFNHNCTRIVTASDDRTAKVWDTITGQLMYTLEGHRGVVVSAVFNHDDTRILTASWDGTAKLWDAMTGQLLLTLEGHRGSVNSAVFNQDGTRILTASADHTAELLNANTGQLLHTLEGHHNRIYSAIFNHNETRILTVSIDNTANLWDASTGQLLHTLEGHSHSLASGVFNHNGTRILTTSGDTAKLWDASTGQLLHTLEGHQNLLYSAVFNQDGTRILTASKDDTAKMWQYIDIAQANKNAGLVLPPEEVFAVLEQLCGANTADRIATLSNLLALIGKHSAQRAQKIQSADHQMAITP